MVVMCSPETQFYIIPLEGNRLNSISSFSPLLLKYWSTTKTPFFPLIACSLAADILLILKISNIDVDMTIHISALQVLVRNLKNCKGKHMINWEIFYPCTSLPGTNIGQKTKEIEMLDSLKGAWKFPYGFIYHLWQATPSEWLQETAPLPVCKAWDQQKLPLQSVYNF